MIHGQHPGDVRKAMRALASIEAGIKALNEINPDLVRSHIDQLCEDFGHYPRDEREVEGSFWPAGVAEVAIEWIVPHLRARADESQRAMPGLQSITAGSLLAAASVIETDAGHKET